MLSRFNLADILLPQRSPVNLKTAILGRMVIVAFASFILVMAYGLFETRRENKALDKKTVDLVVHHVILAQLAVGSSSFDATALSMRWKAALTDFLVGGQCVRFVDPEDRMLLNNCIGSAATRTEIPRWYSLLYSTLFSTSVSETRKVFRRHLFYGTVTVISNPQVEMARGWDQMRQMLSLFVVTILSLGVLVYFAVEHALAPTKAVVKGLDRLAKGEFTYRLPNVGLTELQRISEVSNQLAEKVESTLAERAMLSVRLMNAQEDERRYLARELHDEFAQNLTAINALASAVECSVKKEKPELCVEAQRLSQISMSMMTSLRGTLSHLRPAELDKFGLTESLRQLVSVWKASTRGKTKFELHVKGEIPPLPDNVAVHVFRIAQEGLTNAAKHADAKTVRLLVEPVSMSNGKSTGNKSLKITIEDDGKGLQRRHHQASKSGRGHLNMQERVSALGGSMSFIERPCGGLAVCVNVPVSGEQEETS